MVVLSLAELCNAGRRPSNAQELYAALTGTACGCNTVMYSLLYASGLYSNAPNFQQKLSTYQQQVSDCYGGFAYEEYSGSVNPGVAGIPAWAYLEPNDDEFDIARAQSIAGEDIPDCTKSGPSCRAASGASSTTRDPASLPSTPLSGQTPTSSEPTANPQSSRPEHPAGSSITVVSGAGTGSSTHTSPPRPPPPSPSPSPLAGQSTGISGAAAPSTATSAPGSSSAAGPSTPRPEPGLTAGASSTAVSRPPPPTTPPPAGPPAGGPSTSAGAPDTAARPRLIAGGVLFGAGGLALLAALALARALPARVRRYGVRARVC
ncbi:hypothetical protein BD413DRAFT_669279 [Trametes elegans]|nr:hypothetical protein BD413DRAFT_669279 [Trametes elegans]